MNFVSLRRIENSDLDQLLDTAYRLYGYDFREYALTPLWRRIVRIVREDNFGSIAALHRRVLRDEVFAVKFLSSISVNVTEMFRDPGFYEAFRGQIIPLLSEFPYIRIWDIGCASGQETYSLAIILEEENLYDRCLIYATDINHFALKRARDGVYSLASMKGYTRNYINAGGERSFSQYYVAGFDHAIVSSRLRRRIVFAQHNVATDSSFNSFDLIICRNVLIYFSKALQDRVHKTIYDTISDKGILALGPRESLQFTPKEACYEVLDYDQRLYRKLVMIERSLPENGGLQRSGDGTDLS